MAIKTKSIAEVTAKWNTRAAAAAPDYQKGIQAPAEDWGTNTKAAETAYEAGVQGSIARKAFGRGVTKAGTEKWQRKSQAVGPARYGQGVSAGQQDYQSEFGPYLDVIGRVALPPRGMRGDPNNLERVRVIANALHTQKTGAA
jgi:hypothetical protein